MNKSSFFAVALWCSFSFLPFAFSDTSLPATPDSNLIAERTHFVRHRVDVDHPGWGFQEGYFGRHHGGRYNLWNRVGGGGLHNGWGGNVGTVGLRRQSPYSYINYFNSSEGPINEEAYYYFYPRYRN